MSKCENKVKSKKRKQEGKIKKRKNKILKNIKTHSIDKYFNK